MDKAIEAFKMSDEFTRRLDEQYAAGYEDFHFDANEAYPKMDFNVFKVPIAAETSSEDVNIMDDASTEPSKDDSKSGDAPSGLSK